jgi:hypothetical protein
VYYLLRATRPTTIADIAVGKLVKVVGRIRAAGPRLTAPFAQAPCVFYRCTAWDDSGPPPGFVCGEQRAQDFLVEDPSGMALVRIDSISSEVFVDMNRCVKWQDISAQRQLLERHGQTFRASCYFLEERLDEGAVVSVRGRVSWEVHEAGEGGSLREAPQIHVLSAPAMGKLVVSDAGATFG